MQGAKKAMETVKETAANVGASAQSGMEKTKATLGEKKERMTAHDPMQKEMATDKKEERINRAELQKQEAREHNAAVKQSATAAADRRTNHSNPASGFHGHATEFGSGPGIDTYSNTGAGRHGHSTGTGVDTYSTPGAGGYGQPTGTTTGTGGYGHSTGIRTGAGGYGHPTGTGSDTATYPTTGEYGQQTGDHQMSAMADHRMEQLVGENVSGGLAGSHPVGTDTGAGRTASRNTRTNGATRFDP